MIKSGNPSCRWLGCSRPTEDEAASSVYCSLHADRVDEVSKYRAAQAQLVKWKSLCKLLVRAHYGSRATMQPHVEMQAFDEARKLLEDEGIFSED